MHLRISEYSTNTRIIILLALLAAAMLLLRAQVAARDAGAPAERIRAFPESKICRLYTTSARISPPPARRAF